MGVPLNRYLGPDLFSVAQALEGVLDGLEVLDTRVENIETPIPGTEHEVTFDEYDEGLGITYPVTRMEAAYERTTRVYIGIAGAGEVAFTLPFLDGVSCVIAPLPGEDVFGLRADLTAGGDFEVGIGVTMRLRFAPDVLAPVRRVEAADGRVSYEPDTASGPLEVTIGRLELRLGPDGVTVDAGAGFSIDRAVAVGDTGVVLEALQDVTVNFVGGDARPAEAPEDWRGLYIGRATVLVPDALRGSFAVEGLGLGAGGLWGLIGYRAFPGLEFAADERRFTGSDLAGELLGFAGGVEAIELSFVQSVPTQGSIRGGLLLPFFDQPFWLAISIGSDGSFAVAVIGEDGGALARLEQPDLFVLQLAGLHVERADDVVWFWLAGRVQLLVGGIDWPALDVSRLGVSSTGEVDIDGGWVDVPESFTLDFHAFKVELEQIGFGTEGEGDAQRQWVGLSGGIRLIEGIPLSASVEGLRVSWRPPPHEPDIAVSMEGVAVHLEIPGTLVLDGSVRYRQVPRPPEVRPATDPGSTVDTAAAQAGVFGQVFTGSITVELTALNTEIAGDLLIGELTSYRYDDAGALVVGETFAALYIVLSVEFPGAVPLGATGVGLYGVKGLFGMHVAPDRHLDDEGEPESWYQWYRAEDRPRDSGYSVTKVSKWAPRFDNYAFGAGVTLGTVFDDGFTINAGLLAAILIPGPVVMIEGRANLIKPRGGSGAEGALYALIVFDGLAETFQMNVDVNFALEDVITVGGGLEAFFDFNDGDAWYIYIGRKDPAEKRIRAEVLSIITATAYFMVDPHGIVFGAAAGLDFQAEYGPLEIKAILRIAFEVGIFWKEPQLTGMVELYGEISIKVFGIGLGLILQALLEGSAPQPWWIHGLARAALSLPFPLPSFDVSVEFTWGSSGPPALVDLIKGATMVHPRLPGTTWALPDAASTPESQWPVVPVDAIPVLSLAKPLSDISLVRTEEGSPDWFRTEVTEGIEFGYRLRDLVLEERDPAGAWVSVPRWSVPEPRYRDLQVRPDQYAQEPQVQLWWYAPLDTYDRISRRNYADPCGGPDEPQRHCVDWRGVADGTVLSPISRRGGLTLVGGLGEPPLVRLISPPPPATEPDRGLRIRHLVVRFPEPVSLIEVRWAAADARFAAFHDGRAVAVAPHPAGARVYQVLAGMVADTLHIDATRGALDATLVPVLQSICWVTAREAHAATHRTGPAEERTLMRSELLLRPLSSYRLRATGVRTQRTVDSDEIATETAQGSPEDPGRGYLIWGFHTGGLPGTDYSRSTVAATLPGGARPDFADTAPNQVASYVARTVPAAGSPRFYRGYDALVELADPYAATMLSTAVDVRVLDRNGTTLASSRGLPLRTGALPFVTPGLLTVLTAERDIGCAASPVPWRRQVIDRYVTVPLPSGTGTRTMVRVELMAQPPYGDGPVFGFEFATSMFRDIADHLDAGGEVTVRRLGTAPAPPMGWREGLRARTDRLTGLRAALAIAYAIGEHDSGVTIVGATAEIAALRSELDEVYRAVYESLDRGGVAEVAATPTPTLPDLRPTTAVTFSYPGVHSLFEAAGLGHRPLPPRRVELLVLDTGAGWFLLLEAPEPLDPARLWVERADTSTPLPVVWSHDGSRAFLFDANPSGLFTSTAVDLRWRFARGGPAAPDLDPLYRHGELVDEDVVTWRVAYPG